MNKKVAIITGASNGIGQAVATHFAAKNYHTILIARSENKLAALANEIKNNKGSADYYAVDVSDKEKLKSCIDDVFQKHGRIDFLLNNAGIFKRGTTEVDLDDVDEVIAINLLGAIYTAKFVAKYMKQQKFGYIINLSSLSGKRGLSFNGIYAASKHGLVGYGESLFKKLMPYNVKVTTLCPSVIATDMTKDFGMPENQKMTTDDVVTTIEYLLTLGPNAAVQEIIMQCTAFVSAEAQSYNRHFIKDEEKMNN